MPQPTGLERPDGEKGVEEKQSSLQAERGVHKVSQRGVDQVTLIDGARGDSEITDEVMRVAVLRSKTPRRNGFERQVRRSRDNP